MLSSTEIRQKFIDYFKSKQHAIVPSSPIVVKNDPTLLFTNAGMNQFKEFFLGEKTPDNTRVANTQKCLRVSGKHNDLEEVGVDTYHHTMFEMLGNWSFGDYFKQEAIDFAWELLIKVYNIDKNNLYVTVFGGDVSENLSKDEEAFNLWKKHIPEDRILFFGKKDNFWEMGETGPCGPCSEIHVDIRSIEEKNKVPGKDLVNTGDPQVIEIWNLVFIQYERKKDTSLVSLPSKHIDTGMGFERLTRVIQQKSSNYDTDIFTPYIQALEKLALIKYGENEKTDIACRVIADHIRAISFCIADGQLPSNTGAGYVIRRILRRAIRYAYSFLNIKEPFLFSLVPTLSSQMGSFFPELQKQKDLIMNVLREEETQFFKTLERGIQLFEQKIQEEKTNILSGSFAFTLYDTYGFPIDLTELLAKEKNISVDIEAFHECLQEQKNRSKSASKMDVDDWVILDPQPENIFIGYDSLQEEIKISKYRSVNIKNKTIYQFVFNKTPFYPEGGGQIGDSGYLENQEEKIPIFTTKKENNLIIHYSEILPKNPQKLFRAKVDLKKRHLTSCNHSATHLLHYALRKTLGTHVEQRGSYVSDEYLRFDFSHFQRVSEQELEIIETLMNDMIQQNIRLTEKRNIPIQDAMKMGAMSLFGEKYGDSVRVIQFGDSIELCGGTHIPETSQLGYVKIISESSVAAGIRRIEAVSSEGAIKYFKNIEKTMQQIQSFLNHPKNLEKHIEELVAQNDEQKKMLDELIIQKAEQWKQRILQNKIEKSGLEILFSETDLPENVVKDVIFQLKNSNNRIILITKKGASKATISIGISNDVVENKKLHAGNLVRELAKEINGNGGGQAFFATAGGTNPSGIDNIFSKLQSLI